MEFKAQKLSSSYNVSNIGRVMDIYESSMTALKIPFFPLGLRFPAGDVLNAVIVNWMVRFSAPLLQFSFSFLSHSLFSQSLFLASLLSLFTND
jgi:hypothetical protein